LAGYVLRVLKQRDGQLLRGHNTTFFVRHSEALIIDDPNLVPDRWKQVTVETHVSKDPVKRAIKAGESIPGVHIEVRDNLQRK
jgi:hypothetical protein